MCLFIYKVIVKTKGDKNEKFYTLITLTGVYDLDDFVYEKFYTLHNGYVKEKKTLFYDELDAVIELFKDYNSEIVKTLDAVMVTEHILKGHDLCPEFSEDEEMNKLVAPLSSNSVDLLIEFDQKSKRKESENEERR